MIPIFATLFARWGVAERLRKPLQWLIIGIASIALLWGAKALYDASVIREHETKRTAQSIEARDSSAEERAIDTLGNALRASEREKAIASAAAEEAAKPPEARATLPPTTRALNCQRMEQAYSKRELERMAAYQRECGN